MIGDLNYAVGFNYICTDVLLLELLVDNNNLQVDSVSRKIMIFDWDCESIKISNLQATSSITVQLGVKPSEHPGTQ